MNSQGDRNGAAKPVITLVYMGIMIVLDIITVRFFSIQTPAMRIGLGFIAIIIAGMYLGPVKAGIVGFVADLLGMFLFPRGAFFPGFTLSAIMNGLIAGFFLEGRKASFRRNVILYALLSTLIVDTLMNTTWLVMMLHQNDLTKFLVALVPRIPNQIVVTVLKIVMVPIIYRSIYSRFKGKGLERT